jgi:hypothetical protein
VTIQKPQLLQQDAGCNQTPQASGINNLGPIQTRIQSDLTSVMRLSCVAIGPVDSSLLMHPFVNSVLVFSV